VSEEKEFPVLTAADLGLRARLDKVVRRKMSGPATVCIMVYKVLVFCIEKLHGAEAFLRS
jgi:hypothetical protein